jgi:NCAIR mutase (PurE)-related protein
MDEEAAQNPLKDIEALDLEFPKISKKALYKLQISVVQEIQSRESSDAMKLQIAQEENITLKEVISQEGKEKKIVQQKVEETEKQTSVVFQTISYSADSEGVYFEEKMKKIMQALE